MLFKESFDSSETESCVTNDGVFTNDQCSDPNFTAGTYCNRFDELQVNKNILL